MDVGCRRKVALMENMVLGGCDAAPFGHMQCGPELVHDSEIVLLVEQKVYEEALRELYLGMYDTRELHT